MYMPGGHGPMSDLAWDADCGRLLTAQKLASGNPLFIVCHAPAAMLATRIHGVSPFKGYRVTGFTNEEEEAVGVAPMAPWLLETRSKGEGRCRLQPRPDLGAVHGRGPQPGHRPEPGAQAAVLANRMLEILGPSGRTLLPRLSTRQCLDTRIAVWVMAVNESSQTERWSRMRAEYRSQH